MYGALELAERLRLHGGAALPPATTLRGAPALPIRAANMFWTLPDPDQPETEWWFHDEQFWRDYLDLLAHARLQPARTSTACTTWGRPGFRTCWCSSPAPPPSPTSACRPPSGSEHGDAQPRIAMARARGIRVGLMTDYPVVEGYSPTPLSDADLQIYVREAALDLATRAPGLALLGFRIGESGQGATGYIDTIVAATRAAATGVTPYTRSWVSSKPEIVALATAVGPEMVLERSSTASTSARPTPLRAAR